MRKLDSVYIATVVAPNASAPSLSLLDAHVIESPGSIPSAARPGLESLRMLRMDAARVADVEAELEAQMAKMMGCILHARDSLESQKSALRSSGPLGVVGRPSNLVVSCDRDLQYFEECAAEIDLQPEYQGVDLKAKADQSKDLDAIRDYVSGWTG